MERHHEQTQRSRGSWRTKKEKAKDSNLSVRRRRFPKEGELRSEIMTRSDLVESNCDGFSDSDDGDDE
jgi:hypothetical protein